MRQSALDLSQLTMAVRDPSLDLSALAGPYDSTPTFDAQRIAYIGVSFGAVIGTLFAAIEPNVSTSVPFPQRPEPIKIANPIDPTLEQVVSIMVDPAQGRAPRVDSTLAPSTALNNLFFPRLRAVARGQY